MKKNLLTLAYWLFWQVYVETMVATFLKPQTPWQWVSIQPIAIALALVLLGITMGNQNRK